MAIIGLAGARGSGRSEAATALELLGYERAGFRDRLRYMISMAAGLSDETMLKKADDAFPQPVTLQPFHIDGMVRLASAWRTITPQATHKMREVARRQPLVNAREVMDFVRELFADAVSESFWIDVFKLTFKPDEHPNLIVDDVATPEEREFLRGLDGVLVGIERPGFDCELADCDLVVRNEGTVQELQDQMLAAVFGHLRGTPMAVGGADRVVVQSAPNGELEATRQLRDQLQRDNDALLRRIEELQGNLERGLADRDAKLAEANTALQAERDGKGRALGESRAEVEQLRNRVSQLSEQLAAGGSAVAPAPTVVVSAGGLDETDTASLVARVALALGYEAGLGKDNHGTPMICVDLPAGQVTWPVAEGLYPFLPRYDKACEDLLPTERRERLLNPNINVSLTSARALEREDSQLSVLGGFLLDLILLAEGCKVHRAYRAKRPPTGDCPTCWAMWDSGERLTKLVGLYGPAAQPTPEPPATS